MDFADCQVLGFQLKKEVKEKGTVEDAKLSTNNQQASVNHQSLKSGPLKSEFIIQAQ